MRASFHCAHVRCVHRAPHRASAEAGCTARNGQTSAPIDTPGCTAQTPKLSGRHNQCERADTGTGSDMQTCRLAAAMPSSHQAACACTCPLHRLCLPTPSKQPSSVAGRRASRLTAADAWRASKPPSAGLPRASGPAPPGSNSRSRPTTRVSGPAPSLPTRGARARLRVALRRPGARQARHALRRHHARLLHARPRLRLLPVRPLVPRQGEPGNGGGHSFSAHCNLEWAWGAMQGRWRPSSP